MQTHQEKDSQKIDRQKILEAISLATYGRWTEAVKANREILVKTPTDVETLNRLGKALSETGRYSEARTAFKGALEQAPGNVIAKKNLDRLAYIRNAPNDENPGRSVSKLFIQENGKSCWTSVEKPGSGLEGNTVAAGDVLVLDVERANVRVSTKAGVILGRLDPKLARRLIKLVNSGNQYVVVVAAVNPDQISLIIREVYQHVSMVKIVSFPETSFGLRSSDGALSELAARYVDPDLLFGSDLTEDGQEDNGISLRKDILVPWGDLFYQDSEDE